MRRSFSTLQRSLVCDQRDLHFHLFEVLKIQSSLFNNPKQFPRFESHTEEFVSEAISSAERLAEEDFAPHNRKNDMVEPKFDAKTNRVAINPEVSTALGKFYELGFGALHADTDPFGGMQLPTTVTNALMVPFYSANIGTITFPFLTIAAGNMLRKYGSPEQLSSVLQPMYEGKFFGTMNLSETQAGSSLGDITTRAVPLGNGQYSIIGNKMWISGGDHSLSDNIVHMVLAKVADTPTSPLPAGVKGISLFVVPKYRVDSKESNDVSLGGLNKKLGWRGATNCVMNYGENGQCRGEILGKEGQGLAVMFTMMNEARISVGLIATSLGYSGYAHSLQYARERKQGRVQPGGDQTPIVNHADVKRMLLVQKAYVEGSLALCLYASLLVDSSTYAQDKAKAEEDELVLDLLTPIVKSWPSEWCLEANKWAIQIHGGYGFTRDYTVEQTYRDNRLNMIHEGTNGIQSLDLLGRKMKAKGYELFVKRVGEDVALAKKAGDAALASRAVALEEAMARLDSTKTLLLGEKDKALSMANSHEFLNMMGHTCIAWMWLRQETASAGKDEDFYRGKRAASQYFFQHELPKTVAQANLLQSLDRTVLDVKDEFF